MEKQTIQTEFRATGDKKIKALVNNYSLSKELIGNNGKFREVIPREVWTRAIEKVSDLKVFINHQPYVNVMKNIELRAEEDGVYLYGTLSEDSEGVYDAVKSGKLNGVSFGFRALKDKLESSEGYNKRIVEDMELLEVSLLDVEPAYFNTKIEARNLIIPNDLDIKQKQLNLLRLM